jgi:hypothetical protein
VGSSLSCSMPKDLPLLRVPGSGAAWRWWWCVEAVAMVWCFLSIGSSWCSAAWVWVGGLGEGRGVERKGHEIEPSSAKRGLPLKDIQFTDDLGGRSGGIKAKQSDRAVIATESINRIDRLMGKPLALEHKHKHRSRIKAICQIKSKGNEDRASPAEHRPLFFLRIVCT